MRYQNLLATTLLLASLLGAATSASAQAARGGGSSSNAQVIQQLQQLGSERTQLQAENARLKRELEDLKKERDSLQAGQQSLTARERAAAAAATRGTQQREGLESELAQQKERMQQLVAKFRETGQTLREVETDRSAKAQSLAAREQELKACGDHNRALYDLNREVLERFEHQGVWSSLAAKEPFTRLKRTQLENLADAYRDRAEEQRIEPAAPPHPQS